MVQFNIGDLVNYKGTIQEVVSWPGENEFFAQLVQHRGDGASTFTTEHVANLQNLELVKPAPAVDYGTNFEFTPTEAPAVEPATPVTEPDTAAPAATVTE
jgi:hypothetical protein